MSAKPRIVARRPAARTRIFQIEELDLEFSNGEHRTFERLLGGGGSVLVVPMSDPRTLLLTREYAAGMDRYELGFPKGFVEQGEDPIHAANRELQEEVGLVLARDLYEQHAQGDEPEPIEVVPWSTDKLEQLHRRPDFTEARSIAAVYLVRRFLDQELGKSGMDRSFPQ